LQFSRIWERSRPTAARKNFRRVRNPIARQHPSPQAERLLTLGLQIAENSGDPNLLFASCSYLLSIRSFYLLSSLLTRPSAPLQIFIQAFPRRPKDCSLQVVSSFSFQSCSICSFS